MHHLIGILTLGIALSWSQATEIKTWRSPQAEQAIRLAQWEVNDLVFLAKTVVNKPFGRQIHAEVTNTEGRVQKVPLFYNGNNEWVFRYSSASPGKKSFVLRSDIAELDGKEGSLHVAKNTKSDRHGESAGSFHHGLHFRTY